MKRLLNFLFIYVALSTVAYGQSFLSEDFSNTSMPPAGWSIDGHADSWVISNSNTAGGEVPEAGLNYGETSGEYSTFFISPTIDISEASSDVYLKFKHQLINYQGDGTYKIGVATRSGNSDWHTIWEANSGPDILADKKKLKIDNEDAGASDFQFSFFLIGDMYDLSYWSIDDIELFSPYPTDIILSSLTNFPIKYAKTGQGYELKGVVTNNGVDLITSFDVLYSINNGEPVVTQVTPTALPFAESMEFTHEIPVVFPEDGNYDLNVTIENVNGGTDFTPENNTITRNITSIPQIPAKQVLVEEGTGTWCGWCVRGIVHMDSMAQFHDDVFVGVAVHSDDPMENTEYSDALNIRGFPGCKIDRINLNPSGDDPADIKKLVYEKVQIGTPASIVIENVDYNGTTRIVTFDVKSEFQCAVEGELRFTAIIAEDSVTGEGDGWDQKNYYAGGSPMGGFENLPATIPAADMVYNHVGRKVIGGFDGVENSIAAVTEPGLRTYTFEETLSDDWNEKHITIIAAIIQSSTGEILNAFDLHTKLEPNSVKNYVSSNFEVYPNPFNNSINIKNSMGEEINVDLVDISGRIVFSKHGAGDLVIDTQQQLDGIYFLRIRQDEKVEIVKLVK